VTGKDGKDSVMVKIRETVVNEKNSLQLILHLFPFIWHHH